MSVSAVSDTLTATLSYEAEPAASSSGERSAFDFWDPHAFTDKAEGWRFDHAVISCRKAGEVVCEHL
jgi:hypothetical protein